VDDDEDDDGDTEDDDYPMEKPSQYVGSHDEISG
jgi:hypothetical protein